MMQGIVSRPNYAVSKYVGRDLGLYKELGDDLLNRYFNVKTQSVALEQSIANLPSSDPKDNWVKSRAIDNMKSRLSTFAQEGRLFAAEGEIQNITKDFSVDPLLKQLMQKANTKQVEFKKVDDSVGYLESEKNAAKNYMTANSTPISAVDANGDPVDPNSIALGNTDFVAKGDQYTLDWISNPYVKFAEYIKLGDGTAASKYASEELQSRERGIGNYISQVISSSETVTANQINLLYKGLVNSVLFDKYNQQGKVLAESLPMSEIDNRVKEYYNNVASYDEYSKGKTGFINFENRQFAIGKDEDGNPILKTYSELDETEKRSLYQQYRKYNDQASLFTAAVAKHAYIKQDLKIDTNPDQFELLERKAKIEKGVDGIVRTTESQVAFVDATRQTNLNNTIQEQNKILGNPKATFEQQVQARTLRETAAKELISEFDNSFNDVDLNEGFVKLFIRSDDNYSVVDEKTNTILNIKGSEILNGFTSGIINPNYKTILLNQMEKSITSPEQHVLRDIDIVTTDSKFKGVLSSSDRSNLVSNSIKTKVVEASNKAAINRATVYSLNTVSKNAEFIEDNGNMLIQGTNEVIPVTQYKNDLVESEQAYYINSDKKLVKIVGANQIKSSYEGTSGFGDKSGYTLKLKYYDPSTKSYINVVDKDGKELSQQAAFPANSSEARYMDITAAAQEYKDASDEGSKLKIREFIWYQLAPEANNLRGIFVNNKNESPIMETTYVEGTNKNKYYYKYKKSDIGGSTEDGVIYVWNSNLGTNLDALTKNNAGFIKVSGIKNHKDALKAMASVRADKESSLLTNSLTNSKMSKAEFNNDILNDLNN